MSNTHGGKRQGAGRKKGTKAAHTLAAQVARQQLIDKYCAEADAINQALVDKAKKGDILAIKELHDRVFGKANQPISGDEQNRTPIPIIQLHVQGDDSDAEGSGAN